MLRFEGVEDTPVPPAQQQSMTSEEAYTRQGAVSVEAASEPPPSSGQPGPFTREIKIWDPSMLPLGATTHNQDTYKAWDVKPTPQSRQPSYMPSPHKCEGTTTAQSAYQAWPLERPPPPSARAPAPTSPHKFSATTHNQDTYKAYDVKPTPQSRQPAYMPSPHKCEGTTTAQSAYQAWPLERAAQPSGRAPAASSGHKFNAISHNQDTYRAWKIEPVPVARQPSYMPSPHKCEGTTTAAQAYQAWPLERGAAAPRAAVAGPGACSRFEGESESRASYQPKTLPQSLGSPATSSAGLVRPLPFEGQSETSRAFQQPVLLQTHSTMPTLGVVTEGSRFHALIAAGWTPPARGSATFTTVTDLQTEVEIKVVALDPSGSASSQASLGSFTLSGIAPNRVGLPQIVVTFDLSAEMVLLVTAHDRIDDQSKSLVIKDRLPTPPRQRPGSGGL